MTVAVLTALAGLGAAVLFVIATRWPTRWLPRSFGVVVLAGGGLGWLLLIWAFLIEPDMLVVRHVTVDRASWRGPPLRIGLISDTHGGSPHGRASRLRAAMARMNTERPDIVLLAGDYAGGHEGATRRTPEQRSDVLAGVAAFGELRAPLGVYAVLGNHDWWYAADPIAQQLRRSGVTVIDNTSVAVARRTGAFRVAGLASVDPLAGGVDVARALSAAAPDEPVIMLMHEPDSWSGVPAGVALSVAGHSHCGQVNLPFVGRPILPSSGSYRWPCGLYGDGARRLYVTGGVGVSKLPVRFNQPPEIVVITLRQAAP